MFLNFFLLLKRNGIPVSFREYLTLLEGVQQGLVGFNVDNFYALARTALIKHEKFLDRFDVLFAAYFRGIEIIPDEVFKEIPAEWVQANLLLDLTDEEKAELEKAGGLDALMQRFEELLRQQNERHEGGNRWIGTAGTSPFGNNGRNAEGIRVGEKGEGESGGRRSVKPWQQRNYQNLRDDLELNTRTLKMALRRLRLLTREGIPTELDIDATIDHTCRDAGILNVEMMASKQNRVKVLLMLDVGGSMTPYSTLCSELFTAAKHEFKHLEFYYFHNCVYDHVWRDNHRRWSERIPTLDVLHKFNKDYKVIFVSDAAMAPYELNMAGGSSEYGNAETGLTWLRRFFKYYPAVAWLNPEHEKYWEMTYTTQVIYKELGGRMFPLTLKGLEQAIRQLKTPNRKIEGRRDAA